jgi:acyl-CoA thioester hydrolase
LRPVYVHRSSEGHIAGIHSFRTLSVDCTAITTAAYFQRAERMGGARKEAWPAKPLCKTIASQNCNKENSTVTATLDGEIRDGRHHMQVRIYLEDTDAGQIVYHASFLRFMERARTNYLRLLGTHQQELLNEAREDAPAFAFVVRSMKIDFLKFAVMDDLLEVVTVPGEMKGASITLLQECRRGPDVLVTASVRVAFISGGKAQRIPKSLRIAMQGAK